MEIRNRTGSAAEGVIDLDASGRERWLIAIKACFLVGQGTAEAHPASIERVDRTHPDGSLAAPSDFRAARVGTDVIVRGTALAPDGPVASFPASLQVDDRCVKLQVSGPRRWRRDGDALRATEAEPIGRVALTASLAFGGPGDQRNPAGQGAPERGAERREEADLPQIEWSDDRVMSADSRPDPALLGGVPAHWEPRRLFGGTYDAAWVRSRAPLPALDRDDRFFRAADERLSFSRPLRGGEAVVLDNLGRAGRRSFSIPRVAPRLLFEGRWLAPSLDLVVLDVDDDRVSLTFGAWLDVADRLDDRLVVHVTERRVFPSDERAST